VFRALEWLHRLGIVHRDVSLENILIDANDNVKIIDFGASSLQKKCGGAVGKKPYQAPESHLGEHDGIAGDCFALGVTLFSLLMRDYPWLFTSPKEACRKYRFAEAHGVGKFLQQKFGSQSGKFCPAEVSSTGVLRLLLGLLDFDPSSRWHIRKLEAVADTAGFTEDDQPRGSASAWRLEWLYADVKDSASL
jgi:serine/threonine protein kinase